MTLYCGNQLKTSYKYCIIWHAAERVNRNCMTFKINVSTQCYHYNDVIMTTMASQITGLTVVYSTVYSDADQRKHQSSAPLAFVWGIHRDRWIPRKKGQLRGKCFHLMTSSWCQTLMSTLVTYLNILVLITTMHLRISHFITHHSFSCGNHDTF